MTELDEFESWAEKEKEIKNFSRHDDGSYVSERLCDMLDSWQAARQSEGGEPDEWLEMLARRAEDSDITYEATYDPGYDKPIHHACDIEEQVADWIRAQKRAKPQPEGQQGGVPEGWKLVPVEPTSWMLVQGEEGLDDSSVIETWRRMLSATPQPPAHGGQG